MGKEDGTHQPLTFPTAVPQAPTSSKTDEAVKQLGSSPAGDLEEDPATCNRVLAKLRGASIAFKHLEHKPVLTSEEANEVRISSGWKSTVAMGAKAILMKSKGEFKLVVLSAAKALDKKKVVKALGIKSMSFASEDDVFVISGCRRGAVPPMGSRYSTPMQTFVDNSLAEQETINFNCGLRSQ